MALMCQAERQNAGWSDLIGAGAGGLAARSHSAPCGHRGIFGRRLGAALVGLLRRGLAGGVSVTQVVLPGADGGGQVGQAAPPAHRGAWGGVGGRGGGGHLNLPLCRAQGGAVWSCIAAVWIEKRRTSWRLKIVGSGRASCKVSIWNAVDTLEMNIKWIMPEKIFNKQTNV